MEEAKETVEYEQPSTYPFHHLFNLGVAALVKSLIVRDKRQIYVSMRSGFVTPDSFFPRFGMSASDFAVWQILIESPRGPRTGVASVSESLATRGEEHEVQDAREKSKLPRFSKKSLLKKNDAS